MPTVHVKSKTNQHDGYFVNSAHINMSDSLVKC